MLGVAGPDNIAKLDSGYKVSFQVDVSCHSYFVLGLDILLKLLYEGKPGCQSGIEWRTLELVDFTDKLLEFKFAAPFLEQLVCDPVEVVQLFIIEPHSAINNLLLCDYRASAEFLSVIVKHSPRKLALNTIVVLVHENTCKI